MIRLPVRTILLGSFALTLAACVPPTQTPAPAPADAAPSPPAQLLEDVRFLSAPGSGGCSARRPSPAP